MRSASTVPAGFVLPDDLVDITGPDPEPIWFNEVGGLTVRFQAGVGPEFRWLYLKRNSLPSSEDLALEAEKLEWLGTRHPVPAVVNCFRDGDVEFLITEAILGDNAVAPANLRRPNRAIEAIGRGLRRLHELPVADCPWTWSVDDRLALIERDIELAADSVGTPADRPIIGQAPKIDRLVVCHGDPCAPNTLLDEDGAFAGHVDFQRLGIADRWADLAVATMSFGWNFEDFDESVFWDAYGLAPDTERINYYRALWNAG